jgi:hypothetical protein
MSAPFEPSVAAADGLPAADPGAGAPEPAPGFGVSAEEPDVTRDDGDESPGAGAHTSFRTPDPAEIGPDRTQ